MKNKKIFYITGRTCTGKTTFVEQAVSWDSRHVAFYPGKECREKYGEKAFAEADQPEAPDFSEEFVRRRLKEKVNELLLTEYADTLYVDGFPRRPDQLDIVMETMRMPGVEATVYFCVCEENERVRRTGFRTGDSKELVVVREKTEPAAMLNIIESASLRGIRLAYLDLTTNWLHVTGPKPVNVGMWLIGSAFQRMCELGVVSVYAVPTIAQPHMHSSDQHIDEKWIRSEQENMLHVSLRAGVLPEDFLKVYAPRFLIMTPRELPVTIQAPKTYPSKEGGLVTTLSAHEWAYIDSIAKSDVTSLVLKKMGEWLPVVFEGEFSDRTHKNAEYKGRWYK